MSNGPKNYCYMPVFVGEKCISRYWKFLVVVAWLIIDNLIFQKLIIAWLIVVVEKGVIIAGYTGSNITEEAKSGEKKEEKGKKEAKSDLRYNLYNQNWPNHGDENI